MAITSSRTRGPSAAASPPAARTEMLRNRASFWDKGT